MNTDIKRRLKLLLLLLVIIMMGIVIFLGLSRCVETNRQNYSYIRAMTKEEAASVDSEFDAALKSIRGFSELMSEGQDTSEYASYTTFDTLFYAEAGGTEALRLQDTDIIRLGMQGKSGTLIDFDKKVSDEVTLVFYAPVIRSDRVLGVLVGQFTQARMAALLETDCYGTPSRSFLITSEGDIVFASEGLEAHIDTNLFTDFYGEEEPVSTSLDALPSDEETFLALAGALYNGGSFGFTCLYSGLYDTVHVESLEYDGLAIAEAFPGSVCAEMTVRQLRVTFILCALATLFLFLFVDPIAERYARYEQMKLTAGQAEAASAAKSDFLSKMSHDMRTPLNGILGMTDIALRNSDSPEKTRDCLEKIRSSGYYLLNLVNEVLDLHAIEAGKTELHESVVYMPELMESERDIIDNLISGHQLTLTWENELVHRYIRADFMAMQKISLNLMSNAVKYTPTGGKIHIRYWEEPGDKPGDLRICLSVRDTGIGMTREFMDRMFRPYERQEDVRVSKTQGTGLGLAIVKSLTEQMHGTVTVKSAHGQGSEFTVKLPLKPVEELGTTQNPPAPVEAEATLDELDCSAFRCLLVEDNELNLEIARELFSLTGIAIETAENGQRALDMFCAHPEGYYDIIFMDVQMPVMDGYTAARRIRASGRPDAASIPVIAMTANAYEEDVAQALKAGMNAHLAKPVEQRKIAAVLCRYLEVRP